MGSLSLVQQQKMQMKLAPAQLQVIRLLEIPTVDLVQRINEELQQNPVLEEGPDPGAQEHDELEDRDDLLGGDIEDSYREQEQDRREYDAADDDFEPILYSNNGGYDEQFSSREIPYGGDSLIDYLKSQVYLTNMTKPQRHIAKWVLGNIDDDGYLRRTIEQLVDDLSFKEGLQVSDEEMESIVRQIKEFDPPGIASATLKECLLTQLRQKEQTEGVCMATRILNRSYEAFAKHNYERVKQRLDITDEQLRMGINEIMRLNQSPTNAFEANAIDTRREQIIPDAEITHQDGRLRVTLMSDHIPALHVSGEYQQMMEDMKSTKEQRQKNRDAVQFIRDNINSAATFIEAIRLRNETLLLTIRSIAEAQKDFFLNGDESLIRPLVLQTIADEIGMDVSTVSRACNNKYVQTDFGIYPLKFFFSDTMKTSDGEDVSTRAIKKIMRELVDSEDKSNPIDDEGLAALLTERGYPLARRTVAKYRDLLGIPVARLRRQI